MKTLIEIMARSVGARPQQNKNCDVEYLMDVKALERLVELARADEREAMATEAAKQGWAMKNEDPFEDAVREIAAIRARSNT